MIFENLVFVDIAVQFAWRSRHQKMHEIFERCHQPSWSRLWD